MVYSSQSARETQKIAASVAESVKPGDTIALYGNLGSGKTTFVKGLAQALGVKAIVNSPTFVVIKHYGRLVHGDLYRLKTVADVESTGIYEFLGAKRHITVIEWPEVIEERLPEKTKRIFFKSINENQRTITIN